MQSVLYAILIINELQLSISHSNCLLFVLCLQSHYSKHSFCGVNTWGVKMVGDADRCSSSKWSQNHVFLSNIITVIICSILIPWNAANAAYLRLKAACNIPHCDWLLTCWDIFICMPNTNHHVYPKAVGCWTNLSLIATISTIIHHVLFL